MPIAHSSSFLIAILSSSKQRSPKMTQSRVLTRLQKRKLKDVSKVASVKQDQITQQEQSFAMVRTLLLSSVSIRFAIRSVLFNSILTKRLLQFLGYGQYTPILSKRLECLLGTASSFQKTAIRSAAIRTCRTMADLFIIPFTTQPASYLPIQIPNPVQHAPKRHGF